MYLLGWMLDAEGELHSQDGYGGFVAVRHAFSPKLRVNLAYSPFPKLDLGAELSHAQRRLENGEAGDLMRLHTHVKCSF
ncbi:MAG: hypothetical protein ACK4FW_03270 [Stenotrophomonas sp.]